MRFDIITIFPNFFDSPFKFGIIARAIKNNLIEVNIHNLRNYAQNKHKQVDDKPFGGMKGMILKPEPIFLAVESLKKTGGAITPYVILTSPQGKTLKQDLIKKLAEKNWLIIICGRYEGIDERIMELIDEEISIGDYVLSGGEIPAMVIIDTVARLVDGVVKEKECVETDSFYSKFLKPPVYTRPRVFKGKTVPEVLFSGDHKKIKEWMLKESIRNTYKKRPDLINPEALTETEKKILDEIKKENE